MCQAKTVARGEAGADSAICCTPHQGKRTSAVPCNHAVVHHRLPAAAAGQLELDGLQYAGRRARQLDVAVAAVGAVDAPAQLVHVTLFDLWVRGCIAKRRVSQQLTRHASKEVWLLIEVRLLGFISGLIGHSGTRTKR